MNLNSNRRLVGILAGVLLGMCVAMSAQAATVTVTGKNPSTNTDGSTIPATGDGALTNLRIEYGTCVGTAFGTKAGEVSRTAQAPGANFSEVLNLNPGTSCVRAFVKNSYGVESDASNVSSKVVQPPKPGAPQLAAIDQTVYDVRPNEQTFAFDRGRQVGTVKLGAACDEDRTTGQDFYALERPSKVKLTREPRSQALVARCAEASTPEARRGAADAQNALDDGSGLLVGSGLLAATR